MNLYGIKEVNGIEGECKQVIIPDMNKNIPLSIKSIWDEIIKKSNSIFIPNGLKGCLGDFSAARLENEVNRSNKVCNTIPIHDPESKEKYSVSSIKIPNLPCRKSENEKKSNVDVGICLVSDNCGTFGLSMNIGAKMCASSLFTSKGSKSIIFK